MIWSIAPVSAPLKARNGEPGSALIATGAPVIAACFTGSVYIAKRLSAGAGRTTDWEMMLRMGHSLRLLNLETPGSGQRNSVRFFACEQGSIRDRAGHPIHSNEIRRLQGGNEQVKILYGEAGAGVV